jgi:DNA-binding transcriptional regulator YiaG
MSNTKHTPEPWEVKLLTGIDSKKTGTTVLVFTSPSDSIDTGLRGKNPEADAARIVACVNACEGISNEFLSDMSNYFGKQGRTYYTLVQDMRQAQQQRDELIKAVEAALLQFNNKEPEFDIWIVKDILEKAIESNNIMNNTKKTAVELLIEQLIHEKAFHHEWMEQGGSIHELLKKYKEIEKQQTIPDITSVDFKKMREKKGVSVRTVEAHTGVSNAYISQLETGKAKEPSYKIVKVLFEFYNND